MALLIAIFIISAVIWFSSKIVASIANLVRKLAKTVCIVSGMALLVYVVSNAVVQG